VGRRKASATREVVATVVGGEIEIEVDEWVLRRGKRTCTQEEDALRRRREGRPSSSADGIDGGRLPPLFTPLWRKGGVPNPGHTLPYLKRRCA